MENGEMRHRRMLLRSFPCLLCLALLALAATAATAGRCKYPAGDGGANAWNPGTDANYSRVKDWDGEGSIVNVQAFEDKYYVDEYTAAGSGLGYMSVHARTGGINQPASYLEVYSHSGGEYHLAVICNPAPEWGHFYDSPGTMGTDKFMIRGIGGSATGVCRVDELATFYP